MNAILPQAPKSFGQLKSSEQDKLIEYFKAIALKTAEEEYTKEMRIAYNSYIKMSCVVLHDAMGMTEDDLIIYLGNHKRMFARQVRLLREDAQIEYLNKRMEEIFPKSGFPQEFFDKMLGDEEEQT